MGDSTVEDAAPPGPKPKPTILVPPRGSTESFFAAGLGSLGFSPGPMTLVSSFFTEQGPFSFSHLLAGAMASPMAMKPDFSPADDSPEKEEEEEEEEEGEGDSPVDGENPDGAVGYKRNRPTDLMVAQRQLQPESLSPLFMVPPGLSPSGLLNTPGFVTPLSPFGFGMSHQQALAHVTARAALSQSYTQTHDQNRSTSSSPGPHNHSPSPNHENPPHPSTEPEPSKIESPKPPSRATLHKTAASVTNVGKPAGDGYNWRKYGQKHVKASECPRSYYKCTHLHCPVRKKVGQASDGRVLEIVYKGQHNHGQPMSDNKRGKAGHGPDINRIDDDVEIESRPLDPCMAPRETFDRDGVAGRDNGCAEDDVTVVDDGDDERVAKRRSIDAGPPSIPVSSYQTITESKIVVQTISEVDVLDDGYRWRKYGQKVVKGNAHPRSYYRCTHATCKVRKHVERASTDPKAVVTTYEGKHNHDIPSRAHSSSAHHHANIPWMPRETDTISQDKIPPVTLRLKVEEEQTPS